MKGRLAPAPRAPLSITTSFSAYGRPRLQRSLTTPALDPGDRKRVLLIFLEEQNSAGSLSNYFLGVILSSTFFGGWQLFPLLLIWQLNVSGYRYLCDPELPSGTARAHWARPPACPARAGAWGKQGVGRPLRLGSSTDCQHSPFTAVPLTIHR